MIFLACADGGLICGPILLALAGGAGAGALAWFKGKDKDSEPEPIAHESTLHNSG